MKWTLDCKYWGKLTGTCSFDEYCQNPASHRKGWRKAERVESQISIFSSFFLFPKALSYTAAAALIIVE